MVAGRSSAECAIATGLATDGSEAKRNAAVLAVRRTMLAPEGLGDEFGVEVLGDRLHLTSLDAEHLTVA